MAGELNGGTGSQIVLTLEPTGQPGTYAVHVAHNGVDGGWPTVYGALLGGLDAVVSQIVPGRNLGKSPVFVALLGVFKAFLESLLQAGEAGRIERVTTMPPLPIKEWFKN